MQHAITALSAAALIIRSSQASYRVVPIAARIGFAAARSQNHPVQFGSSLARPQVSNTRCTRCTGTRLRLDHSSNGHSQEHE